MGSIKGNSGEICDLILGYSDRDRRQLHVIYEGGRLLRRFAGKDDNSCYEREAKNSARALESQGPCFVGANWRVRAASSP